MPESGVAWRNQDEILTDEEILRTVRILAGLGIDRVRLTGGEPLVRKNLDGLVAGLKEIPGIRWVKLTTNGLLLKEQLPALVEAGLDGINLSLDTLDRAQYQMVTRRDCLDQVLDSLEAARAVPGLRVKVNCVPLACNRDQWVPLARLAKEEPAMDVRFLELMPIGLGAGMEGQKEGAVLARLEEAFGPSAAWEGELDGGPSRYVAFAGFAGRIGFISAISHPFCERCNRIRITSDGRLKLCLQQSAQLDLRELLRSGAGDERLRRVLGETIARKPVSHHFGDGPAPEDEMCTMNQIGG